MDVRAQLSQLSSEAREALARKDQDSAWTKTAGRRSRRHHRGRGCGGSHAGARTPAARARDANSDRRAELSPGGRDHPHGRRVDGRGVRPLPAGPARAGRPLNDLADPQDGPADVLLRRREHRHRATAGTRQLVVRTADHLSDRPRQVGERTQPALPVGQGSTSSAAASGRSTRARTMSPHTPFGPERRRRSRARRLDGWSTRRAGTGCCRGELDLKRANEHHCNAAWFRVATELDVGRWSDDPQWQARLVEGDRAMSTNHLMGEGYWVWLIRLASGCHQRRHRRRPRFPRVHALQHAR